MFNFQLKVRMPLHIESFCLCKRQSRANKLFVSIYAPFRRFHIRLRTYHHYIKSKSQQKTAFSLHFVTISSVFLSLIVKRC